MDRVPRWPRRAIVLITDRRRAAPGARTAADEIAALERLLDGAIAAGVDAIQIRERDLDAAVLGALAARVAARAEHCGTRVLVNDRADVAVAAGASGVHLPADGLPVLRARALVGSDAWIVGRSTHAGDPREAWTGADYVLFGTVFPSASKPAGWRVAGVPALRACAEAAPMPVIAVGGITIARAEEAVAAGADGVAAIGLFLPDGASPEAMDVERAVQALRGAIAQGMAARR